MIIQRARRKRRAAAIPGPGRFAIAVDNFREDLNERATGDQYLAGFRDDLAADLEMLQAQQGARLTQLENAKKVLNFFERYYSILLSLSTNPIRNTMDEVLSSGSFRLVVANLQITHRGGVLQELEQARSQVEHHLEMIPSE